MDPFVEQLKDLCTSYPTRNKWVFVPSHSLGRTFGERLALEGRNWLNLRFVTPLDIALRMAGPHLVERGIEPSEEGLGPALIMRLLHDLPMQSGYFRPMAEQPSMTEALWADIRELRLAGVRAENLQAEWFSSPTKYTELVSLISAYEKYLDKQHRGDIATVYEEALQHPSWCPIQKADWWTELPDIVWSPVERKLIDSVGGERVVPRAFEVGDSFLPIRILSQSCDRVKAVLSKNPLAFLMNPPSGSESLGMQINLFNAGGREAEIDELFRRILASGSSLDQVEIACASDALASLIWEKAQRHDWAVTLGSGIPACFTRPGRALMGFCDWLETDFSAGQFRRLLESGDLRVDDSVGFTAGQAARQLACASAGWGRATYDLSFARLLKKYEATISDVDSTEDEQAYAKESAELTVKVREWIGQLLKSIPQPDQDRNVDLQRVVSSALEYVRNVTARISALDHRAAAGLEEYILELGALGTFPCSLSRALRFIRERVQSLQVATERPRPGALYVCSLSQCGYTGRKHLFVVGLEEGRGFPSATEDAVLLDDERIHISDRLRLSQDRIDESVYSFLSRLASSTAASATFSYSCRDTREYRETFASRMMLQAFRLQQGNSKLSYTDLKKFLGEPKSAVPEDRNTSVCSLEWWLRSVVNTLEKGTELVEANFPGVAQGCFAEKSRLSDSFTEFDGYVPEAGPILDPCSPENIYPVSELEAAAECPFRFFLKKGLKIRPISENERDKDVWLDPSTRGVELHDLYAALLRRTRAEDRCPNADDRAWLIEQTNARLEELNIEMPAATQEIFERESKDFVADIELFFEAEAASTSSMPIGFEVSFGSALEDAEEKLAREEPMEIDLGDGLLVRVAGRIDRIDKVGETSFEVLDYKTGFYNPQNWQGTFSKGRRLQHALYGLAAVELLKAKYQKPKVEAGVYYFPTHKGRQQRCTIAAPPIEAVAGVIRDLRSVIASGEFSQSADRENCRYCSFGGGCAAYPEGVMEGKSQHARLENYRRLRTHE